MRSAESLTPNQELYAEAQSYEHEALTMAEYASVFPLDRKIRLLTDLAYWGATRDLMKAHLAIDEVTKHGLLDLPLETELIGVVREFTSLASAAKGELLQSTLALVNAVAPQDHYITREQAFVDLAASGDHTIVSQAVDEVRACLHESERPDWLLRLNQVSPEPLAEEVVQDTRNLDDEDAIEVLLRKGPAEKDPVVTAELIKRFNSINPIELPFDSDEGLDIKYYLYDLISMYQITGDELYKRSFNYFIGDLPASLHKARVLKEASTMYDTAPDEIRAIIKETDDDENVDNIKEHLVTTLALQGNYEEAYMEAHTVKTATSYSRAMGLIIQHGGFHLIDEAIRTMVDSRDSFDLYSRDNHLMWAAFATIWNGRIMDAQKVVPHLEDPAKKIRVLRGITQALNGDDNRLIWR